MTTLDLQAIAWFEDLYQKLEANTVPIYQDSIKYVEHQVETVGACVEKFYADLVQNAFPMLLNDLVGPERPCSQSVHCADNATVDKSELDINEKQVTGGDESLSSDSYPGSELDDEYIDDGVSSGSCDLSNSCEQLPHESNTVPIHEDSINYIENQAETVGACVEKLYADLVQNALPLLSNDPVGPETPRLQSVHCADNGIVDKSELDITGKQVTGGNENLSSDSYLACELDEYIDYRVSSGSCTLSYPSEQLPRESTTEVLTLCNKDNSEYQSLPSQKSVLRATPVHADCTAGEVKLCTEMVECIEVDECVASTSAVSRSLSPTIGDDFGNGEEMSKTPYGICYEQVRDEIEQQLDEVKLDESCVLVDKHEHLSVSHLDGKQGSYKKKIRNMLYPRRWSRSKNQKQLNTWNEDTDTNDKESKKIMGAASTLESCNTDLQNNSLESSWEFL